MGKGEVCAQSIIINQRKMKTKQTILKIIYCLIVVLFIHTAISKFIDFKGFRFDMNNQPFPNCLTPVLVWAVPLAEIGIVISLFFERTRLWGLYGTLVLMSLFTVYTALVLMHVFAYVPCSCGGVVKYLKWPEHLALNTFYVAISLLGIRLQKNEPRYRYKVQVA